MVLYNQTEHPKHVLTEKRGKKKSNYCNLNHFLWKAKWVKCKNYSVFKNKYENLLTWKHYYEIQYSLLRNWQWDEGSCLLWKASHKRKHVTKFLIDLRLTSLCWLNWIRNNRKSYFKSCFTARRDKVLDFSQKM